MRSVINPEKVTTAFKFSLEVLTLGVCPACAVEHSATLLSLNKQERDLLNDLMSVHSIENPVIMVVNTSLVPS